MLVGFGDWDYASVCRFTDDVLELNRRVTDVKLVVQAILDVAQDALAHRRRDVGDGNVTGERMRFGADTPYVQIVYIVDALDGANDGFDLLQLHPARRAFQKNVERLANDAESRPENQHADPDR